MVNNLNLTEAEAFELWAAAHGPFREADKDFARKAFFGGRQSAGVSFWTDLRELVSVLAFFATICFFYAMFMWH